MAINPKANFAADVSTYIAAKTLMLAKKNMVMYQLCGKAPLPKGEGRTFQYTRYERIPLPQAVLSEGVSPDGSQMSISTVSAVMDQWGDVVSISDQAIDSIKHPVLQKAIELLAMQASELMDREIIETALSGTNVYYPNAISARGSLGSSDKISTSAIGKVVANLRHDGAIPFDGQFYVGVLDAFAEDDVTNDTTFVDASKYGAIRNLLVNEIGSWKGVRWMRSNTLPILRLLSSNVTGAGANLGSLANATAYDFSVTVVDKNTGFETHMGAKIDVSTGGSDESVDLTLPALPATAPAGSTFNVYAGADGGTRYLYSTGHAASAVVNVASIPTTGQTAPSAAPSGIPVHQSLILGKEGLTCVELNKIKGYLTPAVSSDSDPLVQRRKAGWKADFKAVITNEDFVARLEHATTNN